MSKLQKYLSHHTFQSMQTFSTNSSGTALRFGVFFCLMLTLLVPVLGQITPAEKGNTQKAAVSPDLLPAPKSTFNTSASGASFAPAWEQNRSVFIPSNQSIAPSLWFEGASPDPLLGNIPYYEIQVPIQGFEKLDVNSIRTIGTNSRISQHHGHVMQALSRDYTDNWYPSESVIADAIITIRNQRYQVIRIYPVQVSRDGRMLQVHTEIQYRLNPVGSVSSPLSASKTLVSNSVLSTGDWYKIPVLRDGMHQLDAAYLASMGINISNINPSTLRLFTHVPGMLAQENHVFRFDDLVETPVAVSGENDGRFDPSDYLVFYGQGPHAWQHDTVSGQYVHATHLYADTSFYFLNFNQVVGKRVRPHSASSPTITSNTGRGVAFYEQDKVNLIKTGRQWFGESFDVNNSQTFNLPVSFPHPDSSIRVTVQAAARASIPTAFNISVSGIPVGPVQVNNVQLESYVGNYANIGRQTFLVSPSLAVNGSLPVTINYNRPSSAQGTNGWLDFIRLEYAKQLVMSGGQMQFYLSDNAGPGNVTQLEIAAMNSEYAIWDVTDITDIQNINYSLSGSTASMALALDTRKSITVYRNATSNLLTPASGYRIPNQNLHGQLQAEYILITASGLQTQATQLADFHRNHLNQTVALASVDQIYNEFSGGKQDVSAIRDYVRMFYMRAGGDSALMPRYVCLMGDASYDYRNRLGAGGSFLVPPYESRNSTSFTASFVSDDYYGFMDESEGLWGEGTNNNPLEPLQNHGLDLGIGRLPAKAPAEAQILVNKIIRYVSGKSQFGAWKNTIVMVADHKTDEGSIHVSQADSYSGLIQSEYPVANLEKVYLDYFKGINSAEGFIRFPDAKDALTRSLNQGSLIVNYTGHGGELGWSNSRILEIPDINAINNDNRLPLYMTATCEFGRFDNPELTSGAELIFLRENAGSIAMFTTVRLVYSGPNQALNQNFYRHVFRKDANDGNWLCLGDVYRFTKNDTWVTGGINTRSFALLGDPGIRLAFPVDQAVLTQINGIQISPVPDTMKALGLITLDGEVRNPSGGIREDYNGTLSVTVFDKPSRYSTIINPFNFLWQRNRIFNGSASVRNGKYTVQFKVPLDISYEVGPGKISMYFENGFSDGAGYFSDFIVSGTDTSAVKDDTGPVIDVFMNDEKWADGGLVNQDALLLAKIFDDSGINTLGAGIGHEITAVLNRDENKRIVLNDFYSAKKDSYREGQISYQYKDLAEGTYDLELKVWDIANNSSVAKTNFVVANNAKIALEHVLNYPNPFTTNTRFFFEHNQRGEMLQAVIKVFTVSGRLVKTLEHSFYGEASLVNDIEWDGLDDYGDRIGRGVYVYEVKLKVLSTGESVSKYEKLVLLR